MSFSGHLSGGAIKAIYEGATPSRPVVQIIDIKQIATQNQPTVRYRLVISDGNHFQQAMLATQLNDLIVNNTIANRCVVRLNEYICNMIQNRRIVIVLSIEKLSAPLAANIGNPVNVENKSGANPPQQQQAPQHNPPANVRGPSQHQQQSSMQQQSMHQAAPGDMANIYPIKMLNPYHNRWTIKARVTSKSQIREWSNERGRGKLFSVDLLDNQGGEIRATMFNDAADAFYQILEVDKVFYISKGTLKPANKKFTTIKNEYELTLDTNTVIVPSQDDDAAFPKVVYSFTPIADIINCNKDDTVDLIGVVSHTADVEDLKSKATGKDLKKRTITLVDLSDRSIELTLWGETAENIAWNPADHPVLAIKSAKVSDFRGKSLSSISSTHFEHNPDNQQAHQLRGWFDSQNGQVNAIPLSTSMGSGSARSDSGVVYEPKTFAQLKDEATAREVAADIKGTLTQFKKSEQGPWYTACQVCRRKVASNGATWHCDKCNSDSATCERRYILTFAASDHTGNSWLNSFDEVGSQVLKSTADNLAHMKEYNSAAFDSYLQSQTFKQYRFKVRAKMETYQDQPVTRYTVASVSPIDFIHESNLLIAQIQKLM